MHTFSGDNPTKLYYDIFNELIKNGEEVRPRGKLVKELRPSSIEYKNPLKRVTFLGSRRINVFFQLFESLWILSGKSDVESLINYNNNMGTFSDDGETFNAPYGERIRRWGDNDARGYSADKNVGLDQLLDCYKRLLNDKDTRQATMCIGNPSFDNYEYLVENKGRDIACNLYITFKIRNDKLEMSVFNRSNDLHWGVFGANLCQFSTIQELMCSMLVNSGKEEFENLEVGSYHQITDSLHTYIDSYGSDINDQVVKYYDSDDCISPDADFCFESEPRMDMSQENFYKFLDIYWGELDQLINDNKTISEKETLGKLVGKMNKMLSDGHIDTYWYNAILMFYSYRLIRLSKFVEGITVLSTVRNSQYKVSAMYFLKNFIYKKERDGEDMTVVRDSYETIVSSMCEKVMCPIKSVNIRKYLELRDKEQNE